VIVYCTINTLSVFAIYTIDNEKVTWTPQGQLIKLTYIITDIIVYSFKKCNIIIVN
jgi:hypothetical protein